MGIAAFALSISVGILIFAVFVYAGYTEVTAPGGVAEHEGTSLLIGLSVIALLGIDLVAVGLGIAGLVQQNRKKAFSVMGLVFSASTIIGTILLILIGISM